VFPELLRILKQEAVTGIRIENELRTYAAASATFTSCPKFSPENRRVHGNCVTVTGA